MKFLLQVLVLTFVLATVRPFNLPPTYQQSNELRSSSSLKIGATENEEQNNDAVKSTFPELKLNWKRGLLQGGIALAAIPLITGTSVPDPLKASSEYPIYGSNAIMSQKAHGTTDAMVMENLKWGVDRNTADRISSYNRRFAEFSGYWTSTKFLKEVEPLMEKDPSYKLTFYDSVTGLPLFVAPQGRNFDAWVQESYVHGWPSFRDSEVVWENVRALKDGEMVSTAGTHLGHNLPDRMGNRYCINLVSIAGEQK
mmetsp:Transcript_28521/g.37311  ORF Transcript_28521/g.37311 Transcript_28521/m.37311 type:complete len:254 (-) Transcript_28521:285-1046(-)|eukprot:CAMPEP_0117756140 /NCGR_PEP_ID=MMETSP0947-20121206/13882_1 /TAXON_ID=44440 /ORGANISM="Chattonella subsalsa, Strain CCMP2191" /LENGTH=253 /DNA_ID=CAMNT_0005575633 /DNA_START=61 /DNA_END=822 /DNA_ORIENTATION=-